jgi:hypothetical protein
MYRQVLLDQQSRVIVGRSLFGLSLHAPRYVCRATVGSPNEGVFRLVLCLQRLLVPRHGVKR